MKVSKIENYFFIGTILFGSTVSIDVVFNLIVGAYGLMAIPTMVATLMLSGRVMEAAKIYFSKPLLPTRHPLGDLRDRHRGEG